MRSAACLLLLCVLSCISSRSQEQGCAARAWLDDTVESRRAQLDEVRARYLKDVEPDLAGVPAEARVGVVEWIDDEVSRLSGQYRPGDELWYFREEKCPGCGWYRSGYALVRGCEVVDEIIISDEM